MYRKAILLQILLITTFFTVFPGEPEPPVHAEKEGLISIEAENFSFTEGWNIRSYHTGIGIAPSRDAETDFVSYQLIIDNPGTYYFHLLGNKDRNSSPGENAFTVSIFKDNKLTEETRGIFFPDNINAPIWSGHSLNGSEPVTFHFKKPGSYQLRINNEKEKGYFIDKIVLSNDSSYRPSGSGPIETLYNQVPENNNTEIVLPPYWAFGVIYGGYTDQKETIEVINKLIDGGYPIDAYWIDSYFWDFNAGKGPKGYIDFVGDTVAYPDVQEMWSKFKALSVKSGIWIWNIIQETGNEKVFHDYLEKGYFSNTYINRNGWHNETRNTLTGSIDFNNPEAVEYWKLNLKPFFDKGLDFLKLDNSSSIPFTKAAFEASQEMGLHTKGRGFTLTHLHTTYDTRHKLYPTKWTGDAIIDWTQPDFPNLSVYAMGGFKENIEMIANPRLSTYEIPFLTHDAGGYDYFWSKSQSEELYIRWIQFAAMNTIMTIFSAGKNPTRNHPYAYSEMAGENFRKYTHLRLRLFPYIYSYAINTRLTGKKMVQGDRIHPQQYLFGDELLVAPVYENEARTRTLFLPEGDWIDFETNEVFRGDRYITIEAPLTKLPLFVRSGAILPLRNYARTIELGNNDTLTLKIYPSEIKTQFNLYEDDGISNDYLEGIFSSTLMSVQKTGRKVHFEIEPVIGEYNGMSNERTYIAEFHLSSAPGKVIFNGKPVNKNDKRKKSPYWSFDKSKRILTVGFSSNKLNHASVVAEF